MRLTDAQNLARVLMDEHGLNEWDFGFDYSTKRFGVCMQSRKVIRLSAPLTEERTVEGVRNTILHEIAHAVTGEGHTQVWQEYAIKIGCDGHVRCNEQIKLEDDIIYKCSCREWRVRRPFKSTRVCISCRDNNRSSRLIRIEDI